MDEETFATSDDPTYVCTICGFSTTTKAKSKEHEKEHKEAK